MTTITAKIIADSISSAGKRLTTLQLRYPLIIHAELVTHRMFSRNARSSRAVPIATMIREVEDDPFVPLHWGAAQAGMQAYAECDAYIDEGWRDDKEVAFVDREAAWLTARDYAAFQARAFAAAGYAKQIANRLLAPFLHIDTLVSATEWDGFFELRLHHAAEPHMRMLAEAMRAAMDESAPTLLPVGEWHLPYIDQVELEWLGKLQCLRISAARCARISYAPFDGDASIEAELRRYDLLVGSRPLHASPVEHQATPDSEYGRDWANADDHRNYVGWRQNRAFVEREARGLA